MVALNKQPVTLLVDSADRDWRVPLQNSHSRSTATFATSSESCLIRSQNICSEIPQSQGHQPHLGNIPSSFEIPYSTPTNTSPAMRLTFAALDSLFKTCQQIGIATLTIS